MNNRKILWVLLGLVVLLLILGFWSGTLSFSPQQESIGCASFSSPVDSALTFPFHQQESPGDIAVQGIHGCFVRGLGWINTKIFSDLSGRLYSLQKDITDCALAKGLIDPVTGGFTFTMATSSRVSEMIKCKIKTVGGPRYGGKEEIDSTRFVRSNTSPFKENCPNIGEWVLILGGGHAAVCQIVTCNPNTGVAVVNCQEPPQYGGAPGATYGITIDGTGTMASAGTTIDGGHARSVTTFSTP